MDADDKIKAEPEMSPSAVAAGAIGITVPPKSSSEVDQETGTIKSLRPKVVPLENT